jgi:hypothetical protein
MTTREKLIELRKERAELARSTQNAVVSARIEEINKAVEMLTVRLMEEERNMCVAQTAKRVRRQAKLDPRYKGWRKSGVARDRRLVKLVEKNKTMQMRKASKGKK